MPSHNSYLPWVPEDPSAYVRAYVQKAMRQVDNYDDQQDLVQETIAEWIEEVGASEDPSKFDRARDEGSEEHRALLTVVSRCRQRDRRSRSRDGDRPCPLPDHHPDERDRPSDVVAERNELDAALDAAIARLGEDEQFVVVGRRQGLTFEEIAKARGKESRQWAYDLFRRAREALKKALESYS